VQILFFFICLFVQILLLNLLEHFKRSVNSIFFLHILIRESSILYFYFLIKIYNIFSSVYFGTASSNASFRFIVWGAVAVARFKVLGAATIGCAGSFRAPLQNRYIRRLPRYIRLLTNEYTTICIRWLTDKYIRPTFVGCLALR
jgi:hypothetical protein